MTAAGSWKCETQKVTRVTKGFRVQTLSVSYRCFVQEPQHARVSHGLASGFRNNDCAKYRVRVKEDSHNKSKQVRLPFGTFLLPRAVTSCSYRAIVCTVAAFYCFLLPLTSINPLAPSWSSPLCWITLASNNNLLQISNHYPEPWRTNIPCLAISIYAGDCESDKHATLIKRPTFKALRHHHQHYGILLPTWALSTFSVTAPAAAASSAR